jgi:hypothetical protein
VKLTYHWDLPKITIAICGKDSSQTKANRDIPRFASGASAAPTRASRRWCSPEICRCQRASANLASPKEDLRADSNTDRRARGAAEGSRCPSRRPGPASKLRQPPHNWSRRTPIPRVG